MSLVNVFLLVMNNSLVQNSGHEMLKAYMEYILMLIFLMTKYIYQTLFLSDQFMMANGTLVRTLIHTDVTKYLSFKAVDGSYVFSKGKVMS